MKRDDLVYIDRLVHLIRRRQGATSPWWETYCNVTVFPHYDAPVTNVGLRVNPFPTCVQCLARQGQT